jgi:hypothetical protein
MIAVSHHHLGSPPEAAGGVPHMTSASTCRKRIKNNVIMIVSWSLPKRTRVQLLLPVDTLGVGKVLFINESMTVLRATIFETLPRLWKHPPKSAALIKTQTHPAYFSYSRKVMAPSNSQINASKTLVDLPVSDAIAPDNLADYGVENTDIKTAFGVTLSDTQKLLTGSILDVGFSIPVVELARGLT